MPKFFVRQPDNKFALFATNVDTFLATDMTEDQALSMGTSMWGSDLATKELLEAQQDGPPWNNEEVADDGLSRWRVALRVIAQQHGLEEMKETVAAMECFNEAVSREVADMEEGVSHHTRSPHP